MRFFSLNQFPIYTDDFFLKHLNGRNIKVRDAIVVYNPQDTMIVSPVLPRSRKTLEEHIAYIQQNNIRKAIVAAEDIHFLKECPSIEYLWVIPGIDAENFDYSPLYDLPNIRWLQCDTMYGLRATYKVDEKVKVAEIDYSRIRGLKRLVVRGEKGNKNVNSACEVVSLYFCSGFPNSKTLVGVIPGAKLKFLSVCEAPIQSIDGIEEASGIRRVELLYNRRLTDISALGHLSESLACLEINTCGKIRDFSVLSQLKNLEFLILKGNNIIPDLSFLRDLPKLKHFHMTMSVEDGDLSLCQTIPYVRIQNRKHYSLKNQDLPKSFVDPDEVYPFDIG